MIIRRNIMSQVDTFNHKLNDQDLMNMEQIMIIMDMINHTHNLIHILNYIQVIQRDIIQATQLLKPKHNQ